MPAADPKRTQLGLPPVPGLLPTQAALEALFSELGHRPDAVYVVYDDEGVGRRFFKRGNKKS